MENYYFHDGAQQFGPFALADFQRQPLTSTTSVWKEGIPAWIPAHAMPELRGIVPPAPPATPTMQRPLATKKGGVTTTDWVVWGGIALLVFCIGYYYSTPHPGRLSFSPPALSVVDQERVNPATFLSAAGQYKPNFWLTKWTITGSVSNVAAHTNYKDVIIQVNYLSRTNSVIDSKRYVLYDYFPYGLKKGFNLEVPRPAAAMSCGLQVVGASLY
jgi:GYF domain 2